MAYEITKEILSAWSALITQPNLNFGIGPLQMKNKKLNPYSLRPNKN